MAGNAAEWTASAFPEDKKDKRFSEDFRRLLKGNPFSDNWYVIKGGHFSPTPQLDFFFRTYMRRPLPEDVPSPYVGFRCVKDAPK
jgi:formylglycine-generating enzyme required for sulfatase activity